MLKIMDITITCHYLPTTTTHYRVRIKRVVIAKCDLFFHYCDAKQISSIVAIQNFVQNTKKHTHEFHLYCWDHDCKVNGASIANLVYLLK